MKNKIKIRLESLHPTGIPTKASEFTMELSNSENIVDRLLLRIGDHLYRIDEKGKILGEFGSDKK